MLIIGTMSGCAVNFYDEELRDEVLQNRKNIIDENENLTVLYKSSLYRLALLGAGFDEDEIAQIIEEYSKDIEDKKDAKNTKK